MAANFSVSCGFPARNMAMRAMENRSSRCGPRVVMLLSSQNNDGAEESNSATQTQKEKRKPREQFYDQMLTHVKKAGSDMKQSLSPQRKGDWKDLALMSLSFALYVYVSQRIVCAYCAWMSIPAQSSW